MQMDLRIAIASTALLAVAACATGPKAETGAEASAATSTRVRRDRNVLTPAELNTVQITELTALQAIQQFRPHFLSTSGAVGIGAGEPLLVYVDDTRAGGAEFLNTIRMSQVEHIRYLTPSEATLRYGTGTSGGVINVKLKK
jgi:hypothetical protein